MANFRTTPKILTLEEQKIVCALHKEGVKTTELAARFGVGERTINRVCQGEYRKNAVLKVTKPLEETVKPKKATKIAARPTVPPMPQHRSEVVPRRRVLNNEHLPNGAVLLYNENGDIAKVERCPLYNGKHIAWVTGTVEVTSVQDNLIRGVRKQWSGENIHGWLFFDGSEETGRVKNCGFFYDNMPAQERRDEEKVRDNLAEATGMAKRATKKVKDETAEKIRAALRKS